MCSGSAPAAPESQDLLAIIHPAQHQHQHIPPFPQFTSTKPQRPSLSGRLRLSNAGSGFTTTYFQQSSESLLTPLEERMVVVRIHRFGLPLQEPTSTSSFNATECFLENPVMHAFSIPTSTLTTTSTGETSSLGLAQSRFNLGVGGDGIVGRTVSVADWEGGLLGQGIIGRM